MCDLKIFFRFKYALRYYDISISKLFLGFLEIEYFSEVAWNEIVELLNILWILNQNICKYLIR